MSFRSLLRVDYHKDKTVTLENKKFEIRQSTIPNSGYGLFALEDIPAGTVFMKCENCHLADSVADKLTDSFVDEINTKLLNFDFKCANVNVGKYMNDLAYNNNLPTYDEDFNVSDKINVGYIRHMLTDLMMFGMEVPKIYMYAIKDIKKDSELSRYYGPDYWQQHEFWAQFDKSTDIPNQYIFVDDIRANIMMNYHMYLYGKCVDGKYHYFVSNKYVKYYDPNFIDLLDSITVVTKPDFSKFEGGEVIYCNDCGTNMYLTSYLKKQYNENNCDNVDNGTNSTTGQPQIIYMDTSTDYSFKELKKRFKQAWSDRNKKQFWKAFSNSGFSEANQIRSMSFGVVRVSNIPSKYIPIYQLVIDGDEDCKKHTMYCKQVDGKYYYLVDMIDTNKMYTPEYVNYYDSGFDKLSKTFTDATKEDFTQYSIDETVLINTCVKMHTEDWRNEQSHIKIQTKRQNKYDFWVRNSNSKFRETKKHEDLPGEYVYIDEVMKLNDTEHCYDLFGKLQNNCYHYLIGNQRKYRYFSTSCDDCYDPNFAEISKNFVDVTKESFEQYGKDDEISCRAKSSSIGGYYFKCHLNKLKLHL